MKMPSSRDRLVERAREFAIRAHKRIDHRRKYSKQPYDVHLKTVADLVASVTDDAEMVAAAWLHDTVEDTPATFGEIERAFGAGVAGLVAELTDISKPGDGNRAARKALDRAHLAGASSRSKTVKLADVIDNCADICRHDRRFARVYVAEAMALLDVLGEGDPQLFKRARREVRRCSQRLGLDTAAPLPIDVDEPVLRPTAPSQQRVLRLFSEAFTAKDIAEPLRSFDADADAQQVSSWLDDAGVQMAGVRRGGVVTGFVQRERLSSGRRCGDVARALAPQQILSADAPLSDVIHVLTRYDHCFVSVLGGVDAVATRADIQKPVARMWLFGMITMVEISIAERIRQNWPDGSWHGRLSRSRLEKAETLLEERRRRGQLCDLVDCLQLSDKAHVLLRDPEHLTQLGFVSRSAARQVVKELESLRNNLAHGQDIVSHDWAQIARMARRVEANILQLTETS
jgi:hypothetical protein